MVAGAALTAGLANWETWMLNRAKLAVKMLLHKQGYRLARVPQSVEAAPCPETSGQIVEFIGPSGVGKSSTFRSLAAEIQDRWFFQEHLAKYQFNAFTLDASRQLFYERLVKKRAVEVLDQEVTLPERVNRLAFSLRVANEDMALISQRYSRGFFIDDGLCHNFTRVLLELLEQDDSDAETLVRARAFVVFLVDEPDFVVENILARRKNTKQFRGNNFPSLGRSELRRLCADRDRDCRKMLAVLSRAGCNKLILRAENGIETNAREIRAFEQKLVNGGPHARTDVTASPAGRPLD